MITPDQIAKAYDVFLEKDKAVFLAEEKRIEASEAREKAYNQALDEARLDGITEEARQHQKAQKATRECLTKLHLAERTSRLAQHESRQAGILVDSLNKQVEAEKLALKG